MGMMLNEQFSSHKGQIKYIFLFWMFFSHYKCIWEAILKFCLITTKMAVTEDQLVAAAGAGVADLSLYVTTPFSIMSGISTAIHGPRPSAMAWAIPNLGALRPHKGLKWSVMHILPPRYIFAVFPSNSGSAISGAVIGYVTGTSNSTSNSYFLRSWMCQHLPNHLVP